MAVVSDVPIIGELLDAFVVFGTEARKIFAHPLSFPSDRTLYRRPARALKFLFAGVAISYVVNIPLYATWGLDFPKPVYSLLLLSRMATSLVLMHLFLRILRSRKSFRTTLVVFSYLGGLTIPIQMLFRLPVSLKVGPQLFISPTLNTLGDPAFQQYLLAAFKDPFIQVSLAADYAFGLLTIVFFVIWSRSAHEVGLGRSILAMFLTLLIGFF